MGSVGSLILGLLGGGNFLGINKGGILNKTMITISGNNNKFVCQANLHQCDILIEGDDNIIEIGERATVHSFNIQIKGNGCRVLVGHDVTSNGSNILCMGLNNSIIIGDDCMLSGEIEIWNTDSHYILDANSRKPTNPSKPISIGEHVWIGQHATILKGVTIGHDSIIGMNSVVTKDVPPNCISVGNPAVVKRHGVTWDRKQTILF